MDSNKDVDQSTSLSRIREQVSTKPSEISEIVQKWVLAGALREAQFKNLCYTREMLVWLGVHMEMEEFYKGEDLKESFFALSREVQQTLEGEFSDREIAPFDPWEAAKFYLIAP